MGMQYRARRTAPSHGDTHEERGDEQADGQLPGKRKSGEQERDLQGLPADRIHEEEPVVAEKRKGAQAAGSRPNW